MPVKKPLEDMTTQELLWNAEGNLMKANLDQNSEWGDSIRYLVAKLEDRASPVDWTDSQCVSFYLSALELFIADPDQLHFIKCMSGMMPGFDTMRIQSKRRAQYDKDGLAKGALLEDYNDGRSEAIERDLIRKVDHALNYELRKKKEYKINWQTGKIEPNEDKQSEQSSTSSKEADTSNNDIPIIERTLPTEVSSNCDNQRKIMLIAIAAALCVVGVFVFFLLKPSTESAVTERTAQIEADRSQSILEIRERISTDPVFGFMIANGLLETMNDLGVAKTYSSETVDDYEIDSLPMGLSDGYGEYVIQNCYKATSAFVSKTREASSNEFDGLSQWFDSNEGDQNAVSSEYTNYASAIQGLLFNQTSTGIQAGKAKRCWQIIKADLSQPRIEECDGPVSALWTTITFDYPEENKYLVVGINLGNSYFGYLDVSTLTDYTPSDEAGGVHFGGTID